MELFPSEYQQLDLNRYEKVFIRHALNCAGDFGMLLLNVNPAMLSGESIHVVIVPDGIVLCKFLPLDNPSIFSIFAGAYVAGVYSNTASIVNSKLSSNRSLVDENNQLRVAFSSLCIFPALNRSDIDCSTLSAELVDFVENKCMFAEEFSNLRGSFLDIMNSYLSRSNQAISSAPILIGEMNVNAILQRIAPEYTTVRFAVMPSKEARPGVDEELLVVTDDDIAVRAFRLEPEQINIVNKMTKGDQLILACAGSGKSVLLIAKCFKAARMNPDKKFLITCYNRNLQSLYTWFIERAGLQERNVDCFTFDALCRHLLQKNHQFLPGGADAIDARRSAAMRTLASGAISDQYYGIFIDEVQMFETDWYKMCYNLLENKDNGDHIFVICGDKTQEIKQRQRHGRAPWNAGEGYPTYRGGNKSIRIEKNFRNCVEINEYINRFAKNARALVMDLVPDEEYDPDLFLRGQAFRQGNDVVIKQFSGNALVEAKHIIDSIEYLHDKQGIPYDEIAIAMYNRKYTPLHYFLESAIQTALCEKHIPFNMLYNNDQGWGARYGSGGVSLITFDSVLGLDFQAVIVCGMKPLGVYDQTKRLKSGSAISEETAEQLKKNISYLYVACTRAKDHLHIILSESSKQSIYAKLLTDSQ